MAWEDRNKAQKRQARREAKEYARTDDDRTYYVTTADGTRIKAQGVNSARVLAGKGGTYKTEGWGA